MIGILMSVVAGAAMSIQGVLNTRLSEKIGILESNCVVQGTAFLLALIAIFFFGKGNISGIFDVNKIYWLGGVFGLLITISVMQSIGKLGPTHAISIILISQLLVAALIDAFGILGAERVHFGWTKIGGVAMMILGVILFKYQK